MSVEIRDLDNVLRDWEWVQATYGNVEHIVHPAEDAWRLVKLQEVEGNPNYTVYLENEDGSPAGNVEVARWWPDPSLPPLPPELATYKTIGHHAPTKTEGWIDFGGGGGDFYDPSHQEGANWFWTVTPSDAITKIGFLILTPYRHLDPTFRYNGDSPPPPPPPPPPPAAWPWPGPGITIPSYVSGRKVTNRGVHLHPNGLHNYWMQDADYWVGLMQSMYISWCLAITESDNFLISGAAQALLDGGIIPIVRIKMQFPRPFTHMELVEDLVSLYDQYDAPCIIQWGNEPLDPREWVNGNVPPDAWDVWTDNWNASARIITNLGAIAGFPDGPCFDINPFPYTDPVADLWANGQAVYLGHFYGKGRPTDYPYDMISRYGYQWTQGQYDEALDDFAGDPNWQDISLDSMNTERANHMAPGDTAFKDDTCWRGWELVARRSFTHFGFVVPIAMTEGGIVPRDRAGTGPDTDLRYPLTTPRKVGDWTLDMYNVPSPLFAICPWLLADGDMAGGDVGWPFDSWVGWAYSDMYGREKPVVQTLQENEPPGWDDDPPPPPPPPLPDRAKTFYLCEYQDQIGLEELQAIWDAGYRGVHIRASSGKDKFGNVVLHKDVLFEQHWANAGEIGFLRSAWHYVVQDLWGQAKFFKGVVGSREPEMGIYADLEEANLTAEKANGFLLAADRNFGMTCNVYSSIAWLNSRNIPDWQGDGRLLWLAFWSDANDPQLPDCYDDWEFWQYKCGEFTPFPERVCVDWFNGTTEELLNKYTPEPPPPPPSGPKLAWQFQMIPGEIAALVNSEYVKVIDPGTSDPFPNSKTIVRMFMPDAESNALIWRGAAGAEDWFRKMYTKFEARSWAWAFEGPNEPQPMHDYGFVSALNLFTIRLAELMRDANWRLVGMNLSVGWPFLEYFGNPNPTVRVLGPAIEALYDGGHILGLHEYSAPAMWDGEGAYCLRYRNTVDELRISGYNKIPKIIIGECGIDGGVLSPPQWGKGWKTFCHGNHACYQEQLAWYDNKLREDNEVLAATIFVSGPFADWLDFDFDLEHSRWLNGYIAGS